MGILLYLEDCKSEQLTAQPFVPGYEYQRRSIHDKYGGNRQGGICPSSQVPYIFIFSGNSGKTYGYEDGWDNENVFSYTGEGQNGDMDFTRGNLALKDHLNNGKRVFLFEYSRKGYVKYVTELEYLDVDYFETPDIAGMQRLAIKFFFKRVGVNIPKSYENVITKVGLNEKAPEYSLDIPEETERKGLVTSRVGQGAYRKRVIHKWEYKCAVTGFTRLEVLIASHIVPWAESTNQERLDVNNGILLSPDYDALFDKHLISFEDSGKILLSEGITSEAYHVIGIKGNEKITGFKDLHHGYLERHRRRFLEGAV